MKRVIYVLAAITIVAVILGTTSASGQVEPEENKVSTGVRTATALSTSQSIRRSLSQHPRQAQHGR